MPSRTISHWIALTILASALVLARATPAPAAPADSTAAQAAGSSAMTPGATTPEAASESKETTKEKSGQAAGAKKSTKRGRTKTAAGGKGTVKKVDTKALSGTMPVKPEVIPQHVQVQHILIGFSGSVPGKSISRTMAEAKTLAYQILERARKGENFDELVRKYTDDSPPGIYGMSGTGVPPGQGEFARGSMVAAFGNVGFSISPGNIGIADYDPAASPFGWHIIKRLK